MKKIVKTIPAETRIIPARKQEVYISEDGEEFYSKEKCLEHEEMLKFEKEKERAKKRIEDSKIVVLEGMYYYCSDKNDFELFKDYEGYCYKDPEYTEKIAEFKFDGPDWYWVDIYEEINTYGEYDETIILCSLSGEKKRFEKLKKRYEEFFKKFDK